MSFFKVGYRGCSAKLGLIVDITLLTFSLEKNLSGNLFVFYSQLAVYFEFAVYGKGTFSNTTDFYHVTLQRDILLRINDA